MKKLLGMVVEIHLICKVNSLSPDCRKGLGVMRHTSGMMLERCGGIVVRI